ncbi:hypothetical protein SASPL_138089 [Salvia splendens]|uniref:Mce/MlaD domain-containing protein n=1 Tax=Salvia splendens TaxID=180675 RepID=A0A8X8WUV2_SALSN|nr:hypothetical protein SASPL_138089 [Salvia splendens]
METNMETNSLLLRSYSVKLNSGHGGLSSLPCLITPFRNRKRKTLTLGANSSSADAGHNRQSESKSLLSVVPDVPREILKRTLRPLSDFGFGGKSVWEGGVGLILISGAFLLAFSLAWLRGFQLRSKFNKYLAVFEFAQASGISTGTPVRIRGVNVGNVVRVNPSLRNIEAIVEIEDDKVIIPRNSLVEVNQSGLLMETLIDITPQDPIPVPSVGPLHAGVANTYSLAERIAAVVEDARPLLSKVYALLITYLECILMQDSVSDVVISQIQALAEDVEPLLAEVHDSGLLKDVEHLTRSLTRASEDLRKVQSSILTPENTELIQKSIYTLIFTLKNIENISSDILGFTGDEATRKNLKLLIKSLSRLL